MTDASVPALLAEILEQLIVAQTQIQEIGRRLDHLDAGQAAATDIVPLLESILARAIEDREGNRASFATLAELGAFTHAAANGNHAPLPVTVEDNPLLARWLLSQPADRRSTHRALSTWREDVKGASSAELTRILARQYRPSPTETAANRILRYRLAALTREELQSRGVALPDAPQATIAADRSPEAKARRSEELGRLWSAPTALDLYAEAELAGALDLFAQGQGVTSDPQELAALHQMLGESIAAGERPSPQSGAMSGPAVDRAHADRGPKAL